MASWLLGLFPRASSVTTGQGTSIGHQSPASPAYLHFCPSYHPCGILCSDSFLRRIKNETRKTLLQTKIMKQRHKRGGSCSWTSKTCPNNYCAKSHESEPLAPTSESISEFIKDAMGLTLKLVRPYAAITIVLGILSASFLAMENLSDLSPAFFIGLFQYMTAYLCMQVYHAATNELADVEIDKINKPHHPLASGEYSSRTAVIVASSFLFMSISIGWLVGSWPLRWGTFVTFVLATAYAVNLPFLRWKRFTSLTLVYTIANPLISVYLASFLHMKTHVLKRIATYPRSMIFSLVINGVYCAVIGLAKDLPDIEGDKAGGIQTLAVRFGPKPVFWFCVSLLELTYGVAILVGATYPSLWSKIIMVSSHAIMALVLWCNAKSIDLKSKAASQSFFMIVFKLIWAESIVIALAR